MPNGSGELQQSCYGTMMVVQLESRITTTGNYRVAREVLSAYAMTRILTHLKILHSRREFCNVIVGSAVVSI